MVWGGLVWLSACTSPGSQRIVGPDGTPMAHVHCGSDQGTCFRIAGELCPMGYELQPVLTGNDGNFLVRCRNPAAVAALMPAYPEPAPAAVTRTPQPVAITGRAAQPPRPERPNPANEELDIGY